MESAEPGRGAAPDPAGEATPTPCGTGGLPSGPSLRGRLKRLLAGRGGDGAARRGKAGDGPARPHGGARHVPRAIAAEDAEALLRALADVSTSIWRMQSKLNACAQGGLPQELRSLPRNVQAAADALAAAGLRLWDPLGEPYAPGVAMNPLAFQPEVGLAREVVRETVKPGLYYRDVLLRIPDVIVAQPIDPSPPPGAG